MKSLQILILILLFLFSLNIANWESEVKNNYSLIDCIDGNDNTAEVFNSDKPYQTLKWWIEKTIAFINTNINKPWNEKTASWNVFNIKVNCTMNHILDNVINLNFLWHDYNNELIIEWVWDNWLVIKNIKFQLTYKAWNITFDNAKFDNYNSPYFYNEVSSYMYNTVNPSSSWIKITNSSIKLREGQNMGFHKLYRIRYNQWVTRNYYDYFNQMFIDNSIVDIEINNDFWFKMPAIIKNSKINFINKTWSWIFDVSFLNEWNEQTIEKLINFTLISNEIDLWWNNFISEDLDTVAFLNNKFTNFNKCTPWINPIYLNNLFENSSWSIDISSSKNMYNNVFFWDFDNNKDPYNLKKNFNINNIWAKWIGWIFRKINSLKYFSIDTSSSKLYKEVTGQEIPESRDSIYVIY